MRVKGVRPWTEQDDDELRRIASGGYTLLRAAAKLKRTLQSIQRRARILNIEFKKPAARAPQKDRLRL